MPQHEKVIKREDGSRVRITVEASTRATWSTELYWSFSVHWCEKGKRTWRTPVNHNEWSWRQLGYDDRKKEDIRRYLTLASKEEVEAALIELWEKMKPSFAELEGDT